MKKYKDGDYIALVWENKPEAYYIRGHIEMPEGINIILSEELIGSPDNLGQGRHVYARWSMQGDAPEGCTCILREYDKPGRGRFKVTAFDNLTP